MPLRGTFTSLENPKNCYSRFEIGSKQYHTILKSCIRSETGYKLRIDNSITKSQNPLDKVAFPSIYNSPSIYQSKVQSTAARFSLLLTAEFDAIDRHTPIGGDDNTTCRTAEFDAVNRHTSGLGRGCTLEDYRMSTLRND